MNHSTEIPTIKPLRLTRRGRAVALAILLALALGGGVAAAPMPTLASGAAGPPPTYEWVLVEPGQTLWGIAQQAEPHADPRVTVERIRALNGLPDAGVRAGTRLALPAR